MLCYFPYFQAIVMYLFVAANILKKLMTKTFNAFAIKSFWKNMAFSLNLILSYDILIFNGSNKSHIYYLVCSFSIFNKLLSKI